MLILIFIVSAAMTNMGVCLTQNAQYEKAFPFLEKSLAIKRKHLPPDHYDVALGEIIAFYLQLLN